MNSATLATVRKVKDQNNNHPVGPLGQEGDLRILGRPVELDPNMPNTGLTATYRGCGLLSSSDCATIAGPAPSWRRALKIDRYSLIMYRTSRFQCVTL